MSLSYLGASAVYLMIEFPSVIPAKARIQTCYKVLHIWMPDQVRHDSQSLGTFLNSDTVCSTSVGQLTVAAGIKAARPARLALRSRMAGVVADATYKSEARNTKQIQNSNVQIF